jgi:uncharacterized protein with von Willebrand factor type A (vWA) domain
MSSLRKSSPHTPTDEKSAEGTPSGEGLSANIIRFARLLKSEDIRVPVSCVLDAVKGLPLINISQMEDLYILLRSHFVRRKDDLAAFDSLFFQFWLHDRSVPTDPFPDPSADGDGDSDTTSVGNGETVSFEREGEAADEPPQEEAIRYSPHPLYKKKTSYPTSLEDSESLYESLARVLAPWTNRLGRRYRYGIHGGEISLRRILRRNIQFGGELIFLDYKKRKLKKRRILFLCDVSGSMDLYTLMILEFVHALRRVDPRTEIFFFSTEVSRVTPVFDSLEFSTALSKLPQQVTDWGGGTRIGHSLKAFNRRYGTKMLSSKSIVIIFSDGWDRGEIDVLQEEMALLSRRAYRVIWLNPLVGTQDYQPICRGMSAVLPFVDLFLPARSLHDYQLLGETLGKIAA